MSIPDNWVAGNLPKRGAAPRRKSAQQGPLLARRIARLQQKNLAGQPLAAVLDGRVEKTGRLNGGSLVWGTIAVTVGTSAAILGLILGQPLALISGTLLLGLGCFLFLRNKTGNRSGNDGYFASVRSEAATFDAYLDGILPGLPLAAVPQLARIKELLADIVERMCSQSRAEGIPAEEKFFVLELMSRYVRDACDSYLAVAQAAREVDVSMGEKTPEESLLSQLEILDGRLKNILALAATSEMERLVRHEAFIKTKQQLPR